MRLLPLLVLLLAACSGPRPTRPTSPEAEGPKAQPPTQRHSFNGEGDQEPAGPGAEVSSGSTSSLGPQQIDSTSGYPVVARLELVVPDANPFVAHATLPVPEDFDGGLAIVTRERSPQIAGAQVRTLTRDSDGTVEVIALYSKLERPEGTQPGDRITLDVVRGEFDLAPFSLSPACAELLASGPRLRARDVAGNTYEVDLTRPEEGSAQWLNQASHGHGEVRRWLRTHGVLAPVEGAEKARSHLMGVHSYWTTSTQIDRVGLDLRVHNGVTAGSQPRHSLEEPLGIVHWDSIELVLPRGWKVVPWVEDPFFGEDRIEDGERVVPLVRSYEEGDLHMMPPGAQFHRRLLLLPSAERTGQIPLVEGLAFCRPPSSRESLWSWWSEDTRHYFPGATILPRFDRLFVGPLRGARAMRSRLEEEREGLRTTLETGEVQGGVMAGPLMGWSQPAGVAYPGMTGGSGIQFLEGQQAAYAASTSGIETLLLRHRMNACRQPEAKWNRMGEPVGASLWLNEKGVVPFDFRGHNRLVPPEFRLPMDSGPAASRQVTDVHLARRRPHYDQGSPHLRNGKVSRGVDDLQSWLPHDDQHYVRWTHPAMAIVWLTGDPLATDDVRLAAETFHLMFHGHSHRAAKWSPGVTLKVFEQLAADLPGHGLPMTRSHAWGIDVMCAAFLLEEEAWREEHREWFHRVAKVMIAGAMQSGVIQRRQEPKLFDGKLAGAQSYECMFLLHAQRDLLETVLLEDDPELASALQELHQRTLEFMFWGPVWSCVEEGKSSNVCGPRWQFAVAPAGEWTEPPFASDAYPDRYLPKEGLAGGIEANYVYGPLEYGMRIENGAGGPELSNRYLRKALTCGHAPGRWPSMEKHWMGLAQRSGADTSGNWGSLLGTVQALGAR